MLTGEQLEKFLKTQLKEKANVWKGQFRLSEEDLYYALNIQGVESVNVIVNDKVFYLIPVNNGEFFLKKIVSDDVKFYTTELEDLEELKDVTFDITVFD